MLTEGVLEGVLGTVADGGLDDGNSVGVAVAWGRGEASVVPVGVGDRVGEHVTDGEAELEGGGVEASKDGVAEGEAIVGVWLTSGSDDGL